MALYSTMHWTILSVDGVREFTLVTVLDSNLPRHINEAHGHNKSSTGFHGDVYLRVHCEQLA